MRDDKMRLLEKLETGLHWIWFRDSETDEKLRALMGAGVCRAREDIEPGLLRLTDSGQSLLDSERQERAQKAQQQRRQEDAETKRLEERRQDLADSERHYRGQNKVTILAALISGSAGFVLGLVTDHFFDLFAFINGIE